MSWCSKFGLSEHSRAVLARHASKASAATAVYSRDLLSPILRELNLVLAAIRTDATRSGMLTPGNMPYMGGTPIPLHLGANPGTPFVVPVDSLPKPEEKAVETEVPQPVEKEKEAASAGYEPSECPSPSLPGSWLEVDEKARSSGLFGSPDMEASNQEPAEPRNDLSETTEENSVQASSESETEDTDAPRGYIVEPPSDYVINAKSLVIHCVKSPGLLGCGRKLTPSYTKVYELNGFRLAGISTMAHLAFAFVRPGQEFEEHRFDTWATTMNRGQAPTMGALASLRRLHFEAEVILTATLKASVEQPQDVTTPKPLPFAERTARLERIRTRFPGLSLEGIHEPSQALLDGCMHQHDARILRYIEPSKCNSRELEISMGKSDRKLHIEASKLSIRESKTTPEEDVNTAYKLHQCLKRRAIAYEFAGVISFETHEKYVDKLLRRLNTDPPPNYHATSISQVLKADREVWIYMAQNVSDIRPAADGSRPLDKALHEALSDYNVTFHMLPLPMSSQSAYAPMRNKDENPREYMSGSNFGGKGNQGRKGKGKNKGGGQGSSVAPRGIKGAAGRDSKGRAICLNFSLSEWNEAAAGASCRRGRHVCFKANCFKPHSFASAHADELRKQGAN
eukprot:s2135_g15.t1